MPIETFIFVGISTGQSSIMKIFPEWAKILGLNANILGRDIPLNAPPASYRRIVKDMRADPAVRGALVTAHKIDLLQACRDLFDYFDPHARICDEVSCIAKVDGLLHGFAKDTTSSGTALDRFVPPDHWQGGRRDVLCLGAGGAATAISVCLAERSRNAAHPRRFLLVDIVPGRLDAIRRIHDKLDTAIQFDYYLQGDAAENDALMRQLPQGSLVINATGMGKDRPGSPISDMARFPVNGLIWELNYRGERRFLQQAEAQAEARHLTIEDGWHYFLHGWTQVIAEVFQVEVSDEAFERLQAAAAAHRPAHHGQEKI